MIKILLIENDEACAYTTQGGLELIGVYDVVLAKNGEEGWLLYTQENPDVIVTDIDMPLMNGFELVKKIRAIDSSVIIIMETGKTSPKDVVDSFNMGVDDYIKKPFVADELHVRIQSILKKTEKLSSKSINFSTILSIGNYQLDVSEKTLELRRQKFKLTAREADLLKFLHDNKNTLISKEKILTSFWDNTDNFASRSLDVFISKLRKYLSKDPNIKITTIRGEGIIMEV